jgi:hypothetical protein
MTIGMLVYLVRKMFDFVHRTTNITALGQPSQKALAEISHGNQIIESIEAI